MRIESSKNQNSFNTSSFITLKDQGWLNKQRISGEVAAKALILLENLVKEKTTKSLIELDKIAEEFILQNGCSPTFKNYKGFPASVCCSVNNQIVHGIPSDYVLQEGDLISFDLGATFEGVIADTAITCIFGEAKSERHIKLVKDTEIALMEGIKSIKVGNQLGCIGHAIFKYAKEKGYGVINSMGGHGIDISMDGKTGIPHAAPFVANRSNLNEGIRIEPGLVIAIEPMLTLGDTKTWIDKDGWTVWGKAESAHWEHSVYIHDDYVEILTDRNGL